VHVSLGQPDARVLDPHARAVRGEPDRRRRSRVEAAARRHGVHRVLQQLADVDPRRRVQVVGEQVDQPAQVDLEGVRIE
jgi:hypothetical protein